MPFLVLLGALSVIGGQSASARPQGTADQILLQRANSSLRVSVIGKPAASSGTAVWLNVAARRGGRWQQLPPYHLGDLFMTPRDGDVGQLFLLSSAELSLDFNQAQSGSIGADRLWFKISRNHLVKDWSCSERYGCDAREPIAVVFWRDLRRPASFVESYVNAKRVRWRSWGHLKATGTGVMSYGPSGQTYPVVFTATKLNACPRGRRPGVIGFYREFRWVIRRSGGSERGSAFVYVDDDRTSCRHYYGR